MKNIIFLFLILISASGYSQKTGKNSIEVKGKIIDESSNAALDFATISLFSAPDSSLITGSITENGGLFSVSVNRAGDYYAVVDFIGYESKNVSVFSIPKGKDVFDIGTIAMSLGGINLEEVEITAEKSELQFSLDKRIFNVGKDLSSRGGTASDILDNIPSVTVGVEGEVSLRGSEGVRILINGRPSGLLGLNGTDGLRNLQASQIDRVEVITNPSAKFEAEGMAGIINIILKEDRSRGFNGSFEVSGGFPDRYSAGANLNYRRDKFNFFVNYNHNYRTRISTGNRFQEFLQDDGYFYSVQTQRREGAGRDNSFRFGSDYILSDNSVITGSFLFRYGRDNNANVVTYRDLVSTEQLATQLTENDIDEFILRTDDELEEEPTLEYSLRYDKKFDEDGHTLKANVSFQSNDESESSLFNESLNNLSTVIDESIFRQRSANDEGQRQWRLQLDYERPFGESIKTESGLLGTFRQITNDFLVESFNDGEWENEVGLTNNFIYNEDVVGGYLNVGKEFDALSFQVGARAEYSRIKTELLQTNEVNDNDFLNLFPSAFVSYKLAGNNSLQVSYSRRIRRPRFWDLNPFFTFTDRRNFFSGNPRLQPEFTNSFELGHLKYWEKGNLGSSLYYRQTTDLITRVQTQNPDDQTTIRIPENIGTEDNIGFELVYAYTGIDWLRLDGSFNAFRFITNGVSEEGEDLSVDNYTWTTRVNSRFTFWKDADLQVRVNYRAPRQTTQGRRKSITNITLGASKDITKNITLTLSVSDLLNDRRRRSIFESETLFEESDFQWRPRTFTATLNYRINKKKEKKRPSGNFEGGGDF